MVHSFFEDTIPYYAAIIMYTKSLQTVPVHGTVSTKNRERNEISSLNFHRTIYGRFLGPLSYFEPPLPITSQVMDLRSSHCIIYISMVTHEMASSSHGAWIGYELEKTSPWIRDKDQRSFLRASDNRASYRRCDVIGLSFQDRSRWSRVSGQHLAYI